MILDYDNQELELRRLAMDGPAYGSQQRVIGIALYLLGQLREMDDALVASDVEVDRLTVEAARERAWKEKATLLLENVIAGGQKQEWYERRKALLGDD